MKNRTIFSSLMHIPKDKIEKAWTIVEQKKRDIIINLPTISPRLNPDYDFVCRHEDGLWFRTELYTSIRDEVEPTARAVIDELKLDDPFYLEWVELFDDYGPPKKDYGPKKPRMEIGAFLIVPGEQTHWILPSADAKKLKERKTTTEITIQLSLTEHEARWLRNYVQNYRVQDEEPPECWLNSVFARTQNAQNVLQHANIQLPNAHTQVMEIGAKLLPNPIPRTPPKTI